MKPLLMLCLLGTMMGQEKPIPKPPESWRYMRFGASGVTEFTQDTVTGYSVLVLSHEDIDVSCDAKHWFHLAGDHCLTKAKKMPAALPHCDRKAQTE